MRLAASKSARKASKNAHKACSSRQGRISKPATRNSMVGRLDLMAANDPGTLRDSSARAKAPPLASASFIVSVLVPVAFWFAPLGLAPQTQHGLAIICFMVLAWMTQAMEFAIAGFIGCFLFWALGVVRFPVAFSGFANDTPWFLFAALLIGRVAGKSGL